MEKKTSAAEGHQPTAEVEGKVMVGPSWGEAICHDQRGCYKKKR